MKTTRIPTLLGCLFGFTAIATAQTPLTSGTSVTGDVTNNAWQYYTIQVPADAISLQVNMTASDTNDADMYIRQGANPTTSTWDFHPNQPTSNESATIDNNSNPTLSPGSTYHIGVTTADNGTASYTLVVTVTLASNPSATRRYRVTWVNDPSTTATIGWEQISGNAGTVHYDTVDHGTDASSYAFSKTVDREVNYRGMDNCYARLSGLTPDTAYYFVVQDASGVSERFYFHTAPDTPQPFTFCSGGDSRNNRTPRQQANRLVAKLRPLFVSFTGDMINSDNNIEWQEWLDDWQETITSDGRIFPILPHRGNHESGGNQTVYNLFDTTPDNYYAINIGGNLMRYYTLNSEMAAGGTQLTWLQNDLNNNSATTRHLTAGYHKPMRPHKASKSEGSDEYNSWAQLFYDHGMDLVFESDSHCVKRTAPLMPSTAGGSEEGFIEVSSNDPNATVYTGEGCWGAPLRSADDSKTWTLAAGSFNSFDWVQVYEDRMDLRTVQVTSNEPNVGSNTDADPFAIPANLELWNPASGTVLTVPGDGGSGPQITQLTDGVAESGLSGNAGDELLFRITLPEGTSSLDLTLSGGSGNADIYLKAGGIPTTGDFDQSCTGTTNEQNISLNPPADTLYYVLVKGASAFSGASIVYTSIEPTIEPVFAFGASWNYLDDGSDQGASDTAAPWRQLGVTETWPSGNGQLGFGDGDETTNTQSGHITYYFRKTFNATDITEVISIDGEILYDDGAIIYLNGSEVHRTSTMNAGTTFLYNTPSSAQSSDNSVEAFSIDPALLVEGENLIAVEVHNRSTSSSDLSYDLSLNLTRSPAAPAAPETVFDHGSNWNYLDDGSDQGASDTAAPWRQLGVTETWPSGNGQLGFGDGDETTNTQSGHITYYFRKLVNLTDVNNITSLDFDLLYDDGAIVYINGTEVHRTSLLPAGSVGYLTDTNGFSPDNSHDLFSAPASLLVEGDNLIAVEIHNDSPSSSDISFDLSMELLRAGGSTPPATNIVHWNLDETSGTVASDSSGNSNDGTVSGATWSASGVTGGAIDFDGVDDRVDVSLTHSGAFSVAFWAKSAADGQGAYDSVFSNHNPNTGGTFQIDMGNGFQYRGSQTESFGAAPLDTWVHLAVSCDGSTTKLYYNGQLVQTLAGVADNLFDGIHLGVNRNEGNFFQGSVDDFRLYDSALSDTEIATLAAPPVTPIEITLMDYDDGNASNGIHDADISGGGFDDVVAGDFKNFSDHSIWFTTGSDQATPCSRTNIGDNGAKTNGSLQSSVLSTDRTFLASTAATGYTITEGDTYQASFVWRDASGWNDATGEILFEVGYYANEGNPGFDPALDSFTSIASISSGTSTQNSSWELVSGALSQAAPAAAAGKTLYVRLTANNGYGRTDNMTLTVTTTGSQQQAMMGGGESMAAQQQSASIQEEPTVSYDTFAATAFPAGASNTGANDDYNGNGYSNFVEFAHGMDPTASVTDTSKLPQVVDGDAMKLKFERRADAEVVWTYLISGDLENWDTAIEEVDYTIVVTPLGNGQELVEITLIGAPPQYMQVTPSQP